MLVFMHSPCTGSQKLHITDIQEHTGRLKEALITEFRSACMGDK